MVVKSCRLFRGYVARCCMPMVVKRCIVLQAVRGYVARCCMPMVVKRCVVLQAVPWLCCEERVQEVVE